VRLSGAPAAYTMWIFVLNGAGLLLWTVLRRRAGLLAYARTQWHLAAFGGFGTLASYGLALWAMTQAPVAAIAALARKRRSVRHRHRGLFLRENQPPPLPGHRPDRGGRHTHAHGLTPARAAYCSARWAVRWRWPPCRVVHALRAF
jgi:hypothetical protein